MTDAPYHGRFVGKAHHFALRVYFEDTDFTGIVYHARYLHFCERARSDMLAQAGIDQRAAYDAALGAYAVAEMAIKYHAPARFDDALLVISRVVAVRAAACVIDQRISRDDRLIYSARVTAAFLSTDGRPRRQPADWRAAFTALIDEAPPTVSKAPPL